ncbi:MAG: transglutaminase family protein [Dorea sp.]|nr:transglutaminase family protein [Dorea sp.]
MKTLQFDYYMQIDYSVDIEKCNFTIKCIPKNNARQQIKDMAIDLYPETTYSEGVDGLRNQQIYGYNEMPHHTFFFHLSGTAFTGLSDYEEEENTDLDMVFAHPYGRNKAGETIREYYQKLMEKIPYLVVEGDGKTQAGVRHQNQKNGMNEPLHLAGICQLDLAMWMMHEFHKDFTYQPGSTNIHTTAEEAFAQGCGVCQDYAHIFTALMHLAGIPARYVTGLLIGEGASHAWVEILENGRWYGLDPTNDVEVSEDHIKLAVGRDAHDCMINRGIMHGGADQTQTIRVSVKEI